VAPGKPEKPSAVNYPLLRVLNIAVDAHGPDSTGPRILLSLFVMDTLSWLCYKALQWEAVKQAGLAHSAGTSNLSPMLFALLLSTLETSVRFCSSALAPAAYRWITGADRCQTGPLAVCSTRLYTLCLVAGCAAAFLATPCMWAKTTDAAACDCTVNATAAALAVEDGTCEAAGKPAGDCPLGPAALAWVYAAVYTIFYSGFNQMGISMFTYLSIYLYLYGSLSSRNSLATPRARWDAHSASTPSFSLIYDLYICIYYRIDFHSSPQDSPHALARRLLSL